MAAFCVFGIGMGQCLKTADAKVSRWDKEKNDYVPLPEWVERRDVFAKELFETADRRKQVSPEFDAPQFCEDWIAVAGERQVRLPKIMTRGEKTDKHGTVIKKEGKPVITWIEYKAKVAA